MEWRPTASLVVTVCFVVILVVVWNRTFNKTESEWNTDQQPPVHVNVLDARIWKCAYPSQALLNKLQSSAHLLQIEVLHSRKNAWIEVLSACNGTKALAEIGLNQCRLVANMEELVAREMQENWRTLQYHVLAEHAAVKREACREGVCEDKDQLMDKPDGWFTHYHNFSESYRWYRELASKHPAVVTLNASIGQSYYDRDLLALHFTEQTDDFTKRARRPKILIQCLLHSREWITGSVCMYIARYLASPQPSDHMLIDLLKKVEFIMIPVTNPDGYYLTWLQYPKYRLWRKNVRALDGTECAGVDLNRNFDTLWGEEGSSGDPCSELYHGPAAASEREVQAITSFIKDNAPVYGAIDFHSYHQEVLFPPAGSASDPEHIKSLDYISQWMASAASQVGVEYTSHKMFDIYTATGTFADWFLDYSKAGHMESYCPIPVTVELRPQLNNPNNIDAGFLLPTDQILPACQEMLPAVIKFAQLTLQAAPKCSTFAT